MKYILTIKQPWLANAMKFILACQFIEIQTQFFSLC